MAIESHQDLMAKKEAQGKDAIKGSNTSPNTAPLNPNINIRSEAEQFIPQISLSAKDLPSKALSYPEGFTIKYRPYSFGEIKKFNQSTLSKIDEYEFILSGIDTSGFDRGMLTFSDFLFIGFLRKLSTFGTGESTISFTCKICKTPNEFRIHPSKIGFENLEIPKVPIKYTLLTGTELKFYPLTVEDWISLLKENKQDDEIAVFSKMCKNLPNDESYKLIYEAQDTDIDNLEEIDTMLYHSVMPIKSICKNEECKFPNNVDLDGGSIMIRPFREDEQSIRSRICFGD